MCRGHSFSFFGCLFSSLLRYKPKCSCIVLPMYILHDIDARSMKIHYLKKSFFITLISLQGLKVGLFISVLFSSSVVFTWL